LVGTPPTSLDWRNKDGQNWITPIKSQGTCGSCVAFGSVAAFEANIRIANSDPNLDINLSEQHLFSCGGGNCITGWFVSSALNYMRDNGVPPESCFPYQGIDGHCSDTCPNWQSQAYKITSWTWVVSDATSIELALVNGPVVATFDVYEDFGGCAINHPDCGYSGYGGGIYHHTGGWLLGGHAVSLIGYDNAQQYWIAKNSWGSGWGENGYFRIGFGEVGINNGVAAMVYPYQGPVTTTTTTTTTTATAYSTLTTTSTTATTTTTTATSMWLSYSTATSYSPTFTSRTTSTITSTVGGSTTTTTGFTTTTTTIYVAAAVAGFSLVGLGLTVPLLSMTGRHLSRSRRNPRAEGGRA